MANTLMTYFGQIFSPVTALERKGEDIAKPNAEPISNRVLEKILSDGYKFKEVLVAPVQLYIRGKYDFVLYCPVHKDEIIRYESKI